MDTSWDDNTSEDLPDTPTISKHCLGVDSFGTLTNYRNAAMDDLGPYIKEVSVETFIEAIAPPMPTDIKVPGLLDDIERGPNPAITNGHWNAFTNEPRTCSNENVAYKPLVEVINTIIEAGSLQRPRSELKFVQQPHQSLQCTFHQASMVPDGYTFHPLHDKEGAPIVQKPAEVGWYQIVFVTEYKKDEVNNALRNAVCISELPLTLIDTHGRPERNAGLHRHDPDSARQSLATLHLRSYSRELSHSDVVLRQKRGGGIRAFEH